MLLMMMRMIIRKMKKDSSEIRNEKKQTPILTPPRSPRTDLPSDKKHTKELTKTNVNASNVPHVSRHAKHLKGVVFEAFLQNYMKTHVITLQPSSSTTILDLQQPPFIKMKDDLQSQVAHPDMWNVLKAKFKKTSTSSGSSRQNVSCK
ncbi:hypothetical protein Tco_0803364 [Tanacetum coccineum]|uniref:Uncharacterized protein n=1 Tax=Tanacetum coccineum TaxID=301880 RepID=A0ABQ5A449_9ASTR